jgi:Na+/proline symporter
MKKITYNFLYPSITDISSAKEAVMYGYLSAALTAGITTISFIIKLFNSNSYDNIYIASVIVGDILPITILGYFIFRMSRIAAILALLLCLFELISRYESNESVVMMAFFIFFYISSIRGTFLYKKYMIVKKNDDEVTNENEIH